MSPHWLDRLNDEAAQRRDTHRDRSLCVSKPGGGEPRLVTRRGRRLINLASNDYLALAAHPRLREAAARAARELGTGATASRLVVGHQPFHEAFERRIAKFKHAEAALVLATGYTANLAALTTLCRAGDLVLCDKLNHASLIDAARMAEHNGAAFRTYPHNNLDALARKLKRFTRDHTGTRDHDRPAAVIVTDSVFSMDGDVADLPALLALAQEHDACLVVDEAHGTGVLGGIGAGLAEHQGVAEAIAQQGLTITTGSKALGGLGGIVTGPRAAIEAMINTARPLIYSTGVPAPQVAALDAALDVIRDEPQRRARLHELIATVRGRVAAMGWRLPPSAAPTPIVPLVVGAEEDALRLADHLEGRGICGIAIRPPTVPPGSARVRLALRCDLTDADIDQLLRALADWPGGASPE